METRHPVQFSLEYPDRDLAPRCATIPSLSMPRFAPQRGRLLARLPRVALGGEEIPTASVAAAEGSAEAIRAVPGQVE